MKKFCTDWDEFKEVQMCNAWVATAVVGSAAIGAGAQIYGAGKAADAQRAAAGESASLQKYMYETTRRDLGTYRDLGIDAQSRLKENDYYTAPIELTQDWLESTPGYKFTQTQGLKAVANSAAARGLGNSGAALKGAANFATGLADNTYKTQFDVANTNKTNAFNRLKSLVDVGENASAQTGVLGEKAAYNSGQAAIGAGNANAAASNATGSAVANFANNVGGYAAYKGLYGSNNSGDYSQRPLTGSDAFINSQTFPGYGG